MATKEPKKEAKKPRSPSPDGEPPKDGLSPPRRRLFRRVLALPLLVVLLVGSAPIIVAHTGLRNSILQAALKPNGTIVCGSASFGWLSPPVLNNLEIRDAQGKVLLEVAALTGEKSLLSLVLNHHDLGQFEIAHPVLHLVTREDGSNAEDVFVPPAGGGQSGAIDIAVKVQVVDGVVSIDDVPAQRQFQLENLAVTLNLGGADNPLEVEGSATLPTEARPASFKIALHAHRLAGSIPQSGDASCQLESLPLNLVQPLLRRVLPGAQLDGLASTNLQCKWGDGVQNDEGSLHGEITVSDLRLAADALAGDELRVERLHVPCQVSRAGDTLKFDQLEIDSDLGQLSVNGSARLRDFSAADLVSSLTHENYAVKGHVDLARLAQLLPHTLRVREGTQITSGQLALTMNSGPEGNGTAWTGRLEASDLSGTAQGRPFTWEKPLVVDFTVNDGPQGPTIEKAHCVSSFLSMEASGTLDNLSATAQYDLGRLVSELSQFLDLTAIQLGGQGSARVAWQRAADGGCTGHAEFQAQQFQFVVPGRRPWQEEKLSVQIDLAGVLGEGGFKQVQSASLQLAAPDERLSVQLAGPIADARSGTWPVQLTWQGQIADWLPRIETWMSLNGWDLAGSGNVQALVNYSSMGTEIVRSNITLDRFHAWGPGLYIDEPRVELACAAKWDPASGQFNSSETTVAAGQLQLRLKDANLETNAASPAGGASGAAAGIVARGGASYQADLSQLRRWFQDPRANPAWTLAGRLSGQADLTTAGGVTTVRAESQIDQLEVTDLAPAAARGARSTGAGGVWREQKLSFYLNGAYNGATDLLTVDKGEIDSDALRGQATGQMAAVMGSRNLDLKGKLDYDWDALAPLWRQYVPDGTKIAGKGSREFLVRGPCPGISSGDALEQLTAEAGLDWSSAELYGLQFGPGELSGKLAGGVVQVKPLELDVSGGHLSILSQLRLAPAPAELRLAKSALVHDVQLTPELCAQSLKFVAPVVANATVAEGKISIDLEGGRLPVADPASGDIVGRLVVDSVQVKAGGMADHLITLGKEIAAVAQSGARGELLPVALLKLDHQTVDFRLVNRRMYHRGLQFVSGKVQITTYGSVGLDDESLSIMAEVPNGSQGQTLQIPIEGTLQHPKIDRSAIPQLAGKMLQNTARGTLDKVNQQLEKLVPLQR